MRIPIVSRLVIASMNQITALLSHNGLLLQSSAELLLQPDENNESCGYYFVDHARAIVFWLESTTTVAQDLPPVTSITHLSKQLFLSSAQPCQRIAELLLRQHYYTHLEYFSMHITLPASVHDELIAILTHACVGAYCHVAHCISD